MLRLTASPIVLLVLFASIAAAGTVTPDPGSALPATAMGLVVEGQGSGPRNGWPVNLNSPGAGFPYTPTLFDIDHDGAAEIFLTGGQTFGLRGDGTFLPGWPTTEHLYMGYGTNEQKPGPSVADLESDGDVEVMWSERDWWAGSAHMWCFNGREPTGANMPGFPQYAPDDYSNALDVPFVLGDADGDGNLEAWGPHTLGNNFVHYRMSAFDHQGLRLFTRDLDPTENTLNLHFGDVDGDGHEEFFALVWHDPWIRLYVFTPNGSDAPGYPVSLISLTGGYLAFGPPVLLDLDHDGDLEILAGYNIGSTSWAYASHHDGSPLSGFPLQIATSSQLFYLGLGDLTADGQPELLALDNHLGAAYRAHAFTLPGGTPLAGWPYTVPQWPHGFPCVVDVDGDGRQDVCVSTDGGQLLAIGSNGSLLPGFPKTMTAASISGVAAGDIDGDGLFELVAATWNGFVYAWDTTGPALPGRADWPMRGVDARYTGIYRQRDPAAVAVHPLEEPRLCLLPNPSAGAVMIQLGVGRTGLIRVDIHDAGGRLVRRLSAAELTTEGALWNGRDARGQAVPTGTYLVRVSSAGGVRSGRATILR